MCIAAIRPAGPYGHVLPPIINHLLQVTFVKDLPAITEEQGRAYDYRYQTRAETLLAVDDMLEAVVQVG